MTYHVSSLSPGCQLLLSRLLWLGNPSPFSFCYFPKSFPHYYPHFEGQPGLHLSLKSSMRLKVAPQLYGRSVLSHLSHQGWTHMQWTYATPYVSSVSSSYHPHHADIYLLLPCCSPVFLAVCWPLALDWWITLGFSLPFTKTLLAPNPAKIDTVLSTLCWFQGRKVLSLFQLIKGRQRLSQGRCTGQGVFGQRENLPHCCMFQPIPESTALSTARSEPKSITAPSFLSESMDRRMGAFPSSKACTFGVLNFPSSGTSRLAVLAHWLPVLLPKPNIGRSHMSTSLTPAAPLVFSFSSHTLDRATIDTMVLVAPPSTIAFPWATTSCVDSNCPMNGASSATCALAAGRLWGASLQSATLWGPPQPEHFRFASVCLNCFQSRPSGPPRWLPLTG